MIVEVCANSLQSALIAQQAGADRIELCSELGVGGITPSQGLLRKIREIINIPVHVLIRPRSGDFTYSDMEFEIMKEDIAHCVEMGFEGIVSGILSPGFYPDMERTAVLKNLSGDLNFTFHRAFDWIKDPIPALLDLETIGVDCILSSGQKRSAFEGLSLLSDLKDKASQCAIMPGGGINEHNIQVFITEGFEAIHLSGTKFHHSSAVVSALPMNSPAFLREDQIAISDPARIKSVVKSVK